ncbi:TipJ family phage tail tip protein [Salipiger marinus]|uniref:TipJ family phage tail tip protein n=1 Tax=Salipiger marinus TaxID=555512 RepID=UPI0040580B9D
MEDGDGVELVRPRPRNDAGEIIDGAEPIETPVVRVTASNAIRASVILHFPMGVYRLNREGEVREFGIAIRIRQRQSSSDPWEEVTTLNIRARRDEAFQRQFTWDLPQRGRWQVEITRMTGESTKSDYINVSHLLALQSVRPEYPLHTDLPLALLAIRIRATHQLTGQLDQVNAVVQRYAPDWTGAAWETGLSRNPASAYVAALTGPGNPWPVAQGGLDWAALADWHQVCAAKGLKYDRVHEGGESLGEALRAIAQAGRASPRHDGRRWSVVVDRPQTADRPQALVVDHLSPRNTRDFRWSRAYTDLPDALRVSFADESNGWDIGEMVIPRPGLVGAPQLTEELVLPGKTDPAEIWREGRRRFYEAMHRPDTFTCVMEGAARVATRGDLVMASWDVLARSQISARVRQALDRFLVIDEELPQEGIEEGGEWGLRWRVYDGPEDSVGRSVVAKITGQGRSLLVAGDEPLPEPGSLVFLGPLAQVSEPMVVVNVEPGEGFSARLTLVAEAAIIDALTEAEAVPAWDSIVGEVIPQLSAPPQMPVWRGLESGPDEESGEILLRVLLGASAGELRLLSGFVLEHRLTGAPGWTALQIAAAEGGAEIAGYTLGQEVQLRARAVAFDGDESPYNTTLTHVIGASAAPVPAALDPEGIVVSGGLGHATLALAVSDPATVTVQLYRTPAGASFDPGTDALGEPRPVTPGATVTLVDGDATRASLLEDGGFDEFGVWTAGSGWTVGGGQASHSPGSAGVISQELTLNPGSTYRVAFQIGAWVAGTLTPELAGGTLQQGAAVSGTGWHFAELVAVTGNTQFRLAASAGFDGAVTAALLYIRTPASAPAGPVEYRLAPCNVDNVSGPTAGPLSTLIF